MPVTSDVLVVGGGIAGLVAALAAAESGAGVTVVRKGAGTLAISSGCVDLLGYVQKEVHEPYAAIADLSPAHPYRLLGPDVVKEGLAFFVRLLEREGLHYAAATNELGEAINSLLPTVLGTLKPSFLLPKTLEPARLFAAKRIMVLGVEALRDMSPKLCRDGLKGERFFSNVQFDTFLLPNPFSHVHRSMTALDVARYVDTEEGESWLMTSLGRFKGLYDCFLLPPILGVRRTSDLASRLSDTVGPCIELLSIPPGVGGLRLQEALLRAASKRGVRFVDNVAVTGAESDNRIVRLVGGEKLRLSAKAYVLATGGLLGGGITAYPDRLQENVLGLPVDAPNGLARTADHVFAKHPIHQCGVRADSMLRPLGAKGVLADNVFLAGRILADYDHAQEKSGHGVAIATGWRAGILAAQACHTGE